MSSLSSKLQVLQSTQPFCKYMPVQTSTEAIGFRTTSNWGTGRCKFWFTLRSNKLFSTPWQRNHYTWPPPQRPHGYKRTLELNHPLILQWKSSMIIINNLALVSMMSSSRIPVTTKMHVANNKGIVILGAAILRLSTGSNLLQYWITLHA